MKPLLLTFLLFPLAAPADAQRIEREDAAADVRGFEMGRSSLKERDLRLTMLQRSTKTLPDGRVLESGRVSWTRQACGDVRRSECYAGEGAELPVTFAAVDQAAGKMVLGPTVWTDAEGRYAAVLPPTERLTGTQTALDEYALILRSERALDLPEAARRFLETSAAAER